VRLLSFDPISVHQSLTYRLSHPTVCVTRAGADGGTPSDEKKAEAWKMPVKRAESPASGARFVRHTLRMPTFLIDSENQTHLEKF